MNNLDATLNIFSRVLIVGGLPSRHGEDEAIQEAVINHQNESLLWIAAPTTWARNDGYPPVMARMKDEAIQEAVINHRNESLLWIAAPTTWARNDGYPPIMARMKDEAIQEAVINHRNESLLWIAAPTT